MSTGDDNIGCLFQIMAALLSLWFGFNTFAGTSVEIAHSSTLELPADIIAPEDEDFPFIVQNNTIIYSYKETMDKPCNYLIKGSIFALDGKPYTNLVVHIEMLPIEEGVEPDRGYWFPYSESTENTGPSIWGGLLPSWDVTYMIWLSDTRDGEQLSPMVLIPTQDCNHNVATINFVQVRPLSQTGN